MVSVVSAFPSAGSDAVVPEVSRTDAHFVRHACSAEYLKRVATCFDSRDGHFQVVSGI